eukprot:s1404_g18.t1
MAEDPSVRRFSFKGGAPEIIQSHAGRPEVQLLKYGGFLSHGGPHFGMPMKASPHPSSFQLFSTSPPTAMLAAGVTAPALRLCHAQQLRAPQRRVSGRGVAMAAVSVVTGAGSGIGRALSLLLASKGLKVVAVGRREQALRETCDMSKAKIEAVAADVATCEGRSQISAKVLSRFHVPSRNQKDTPLSCVVHNAAVTGEVCSPANISLEDFSKTMAINVEGPLFLTKELLPFLTRSRGRVLHISSGAAHRPLTGCLTYCTSKAALLQVMRCLDEDLSPQGVRVGSTMPGVVDTPMQTHLRSQDFEAAELFRSLGRVIGSFEGPKAPPRGLDHPENVADFLSWLLLEVPPEDFAGVRCLKMMRGKGRWRAYG